MAFMIFASPPAQVQVNGGTVTNYGPDVLYYRDDETVSPSVNDGTLTVGTSVDLEGTQWFVSANRSSVDLIGAEPSVPGGGGDGNGPSVIVDGALTDAGYEAAAGQAATDGDRAVDSLNLRDYVRVDGQWAFSALTTTVESITIDSPLENPITFTFGEPTIAGRYANGDWWVQTNARGVVPVTSITPDYDTGRNGYMVNPNIELFSSTQSLDNRAASFVEPAVEIPYDAHADESIVKIVSTTVGAPNQGVQTQFAAVLTVVSAPPALGMMRPPFTGTRKDTITAQDLRLDLLTELASTEHKITDQQALERTAYTRLQAWPYSTAGDSLASYEACGDSVSDPIIGLPSYGNTWGGNMFRIDTELLAWLLSDGSNSEDKATVAIGYAQTGIDCWGAARTGYGGGAGFFRGGGGNGAGMLLPIVFAALMLDNQDMLDWLADGDWTNPGVVSARDLFWETRSFYRAEDSISVGLALWGQPVQFAAPFTDEQSYWNDLNMPDGTGIFNGTTRDPYQLVDGGSPLGESYQDNTSHQVMVLAAIMDNLPELKDAWPTVEDNANVLYEYGSRWGKRGAHALPDDAAPKTETVHATIPADMVDYGITYGGTPDSYITDSGFDVEDSSTWTTSGRWPSRHGYNTAGGNRSTLPAHEFWEAYHAETFPPDGLTLLDDFTGTATPPDAAIWSGSLTGDDGDLLLISNQLGAADAGSRSSISIDSFGPDFALTLDVKTANPVRLLTIYTRMTVDGAIPGGQAVAFKWNGFTGKWEIYHFHDGGYDPVGASVDGTMGDGDGIGIWLTGSTARLYHRNGPAGDFTKVLQLDDIDVTDAGSIVIQMNANEWRLDNLRVSA